jgi:hypothetical protein
LASPIILSVLWTHVIPTIGADSPAQRCPQAPRHQHQVPCRPGTLRTCSMLFAHALCFMPYALCFMLYALCFMLYALCSMLFALCSVLYALCFMLCALCFMLYVLCSMLYALCSMLFAHALCFMLSAHALCFMLYALCFKHHVISTNFPATLVPFTC